MGFTDGAEADLARLDKPIAQRVLKRLRWLAENFETITPETLTGQWQGVFKLRVGNYRVLYACDRAEQKITVHFVRHRREVYKTK
ncbi:type II toxin-antitoxin system RelE/ParE family toxin [Candidatus Sumerlaeota bacterium]|nr:type II toxin-antitoxin system RelE/ParE family toxin [Candidatus Sumerlaeota bacterium]